MATLATRRHRLAPCSRRGDEADWRATPRLRLLTSAATGLGLLTLTAAPAFAQSPVLSHAVPASVQPGRTTEVAFFGEQLADARSVWASFPITSVTVTNAGPDRAVGRFALPADATVGIGAVRVATARGLSSLLLFMVDDLPAAADRGTNRSPATAQPLVLPVAVDGACDELQVNFYRFTAHKGQRVSVEVVARRLGSALDPVVRVLDTKGRELAYSDDDPALGRDSRCAGVIPADGDYFIELRDIEYRGGPKHRFHLRVGNFPLVSFPFPFAATPGTEAKLVFAGRSVEGLKPFTLRVPASAPGQCVPLAAKFPGGQGSTPVSLLLGTANEVTEVEPNDTAPVGPPLTPPVAINGRFARADDRDVFHFLAAKGEQWRIHGRTRTLGSPCDLHLELLAPDGRRLAVSQLSTNENVTLTHTFAAAGTHRLRVEEINRLGGPELAYRLELTRPEPGFALTLDADKVESGGGSATLKVTCVRRDFDGPIQLAAAGLPAGFVFTNSVLAAKATEARVRVQFPPDFAPGQMVHLRVTGTAQVGEREVSVAASTRAALKKLFPDVPYPPAQLDGLVAVGIAVAPPKPAAEPTAKQKQ